MENKISLGRSSLNVLSDWNKINFMYSKGMTVRDIQAYIHEIYWLDKSPTPISNITDRITDLAKQWHNRPLESTYPIVFFDAMHYKVTDEGKVISKAAYTCLAVDIHRQKDLLGL